MSMTGFKSFGNRTVTIRLSSGFTCIVGPNGAGKSNIIDALCFALGRLSKKTMRAKSLEDLIFAGSKGKNPSNKASVTMFFDNSDGVFPGGTETFEITRTIKRGGGGGYKMNGKKSTRQQILNALATANIDPEGSNQFVLQGKIVELTHMNAENRRSFIEELIGLQKYDEMKDVTMKELEKAERDLGQFEAIFKEVSSQLKKVEKEKNDALEWKVLDEKINFFNAQLIALNISKLQVEEDDLERKINESKKIIEELEEKITHQEAILNQEALVMENIQSTIYEREKEREEINEDITQLKTELSSNQTSLTLAKKSIEKLTLDKKNLESLQMELEKGQTFDSIIEVVTKEISDYENQIENAKKEIEKCQQNQAKFDVKIKNNEDEKSTFKAEISKVKQQISSNQSKINVLKANIKKNEVKKKKLNEELSKLKGKAESIEDAIEDTKHLEHETREKIEDLKSKISSENQKQKELENKINLIQEEKINLNSKLSDLQSTLSSLNTEIKMNKESIKNMNLKKVSTEKKTKELSKDKDSKEVLKELLKEKDGVSGKLNELKEKSKEEDSTYKKNEKNLELLKMKQDSTKSEITDNYGKINNLNTELNIFKKEITSLQREKKNLELKINTLSNSVLNSGNALVSYNSKKENFQRRLKELSLEKDLVIKRIKNSEEEYDKNTKDITGILSILNMLAQNINISVETIKGNIQQSNAEAIDNSAEDFKKFILDIIDIMKTIEEVSNNTEKTSETTTMLNSILQTLNLFTDNSDMTIEQLINKVKMSADIAVAESTSNFDNFVMDLMEILENVHLSLQKLTMSKSQELYLQLEEISELKKAQEDESNNIEKKITEINIQKKYDSENLAKSNRRLEEVDKSITELNTKIEKYENEIKERDNFINKKHEEAEKLIIAIKNLKDLKDKYWVNISTIQNDIDINQEKLNTILEKLQELQGIQTLFEDIIELDKNIEKLNKIIEDKKKLIIISEESINKVKLEHESLKNDNIKLNIEKEKFWEITGNLQEQIEEENKNLEEILDNLRSLDNVMRIITSIEEITKETAEARKNIDVSSKNIEIFNSQVDNIQNKVENKQQIIDALREDKAKELDAQKDAQKNLNGLNKNVQKSQGKLNELNKNKERAQQILTLGEEIKNTGKQVELILVEIEKTDENLKIINEKKEIKQEEINTLTQDKNESWKKQKQYQKVITDLKSDLSMENSKTINFESKKIICTEQIETLYERSKDYGTLPPITDDLTKEELQSDIAVSIKKKKAFEPVNLKAIEQYDVVKERFDEIDMRRQAIQRERKAIIDAIDKIELEKTRSFMKAYHEISRTFSAIFQKLSPGGSARLLLDRPDKPFLGGITIEARPRGKKISSIEILSGGEKTLVALAFIFSVQEFYPAPFFVLDEVDAALDVKNCSLVSILIKEFSQHAQFLVISHREENIVNADRIYGVSMQQSGITDVFSVDLEEEAKRLLDLEDVKIEQN
ncbi:MAG: AAA family ATPase [Promethearchaeota archaeon]